MPRKAGPKFNEKDLTKGELRKLTALRKSLGDDIANDAFGKWLETAGVAEVETDKNAEAIVTALNKLLEQGKLKIPRGGYVVTRGRGRVIVSRPEFE